MIFSIGRVLTEILSKQHPTIPDNGLTVCLSLPSKKKISSRKKNFISGLNCASTTVKCDTKAKKIENPNDYGSFCVSCSRPFLAVCQLAICQLNRARTFHSIQSEKRSIIVLTLKKIQILLSKSILNHLFSKNNKKTEFFAEK